MGYGGGLEENIFAEQDCRSVCRLVLVIAS